MHSPMPGDHLIGSLIIRSNQYWHEHAVLTYAFHKLLHPVIIQNLKWMILKRKNLINADF